MYKIVSLCLGSRDLLCLIPCVLRWMSSTCLSANHIILSIVMKHLIDGNIIFSCFWTMVWNLNMSIGIGCRTFVESAILAISSCHICNIRYHIISTVSISGQSIGVGWHFKPWFGGMGRDAHIGQATLNEIT